MKIAALSGKGGTGKTFVSCNLAAAIGKSAYIDCDVEEPNGHLFFKPTEIVEKPVYVKIPQIIADKCNHCRKCADFCHFNALAFINDKPMLFRGVCHMSYALCPKCGEKLYIFGESHIESIAEKYDINSIAKLPIEPKLAKACDKGAIELFDDSWLDKLFHNIDDNKTKGVNTMKIAVSCNGKQIWAHFGHCENFMIYETENGKIISEQSVPNPGHKPGFLPNFLANMGVKVMISGGMGGGAVDIFNERDVEVVLGAQGDAKLAVEAYLRGELKSTGSVCHEHEHADECGEH